MLGREPPCHASNGAGVRVNVVNVPKVGRVESGYLYIPLRRVRDTNSLSGQEELHAPGYIPVTAAAPGVITAPTEVYGGESPGSEREKPMGGVSQAPPGP